MNKENILNNFKTYLLEKGFSKSSIQSYSFGLSSFLLFCGDKKIDILGINENHIEKYSSSLSGSSQSINSKLFSIKKYCEFAKEKGISDINFQAKFKKLKRKKDINLISNKSFVKIIDFIDKNSKINLLKSRDCLIFKFLYYLGIRVSDLVNIRTSDVKINESSLLLDNKEITLNNNLVNDLSRHINNMPNNSFIFFSFATRKFNFDKALTIKSIEDIYNKYIKIIGNNYSINDLRNSYSYNNKYTLPEINRIHSHQSLSYDNEFMMFIE